MSYKTAISTEKEDVTRHSEDKQLYEDHQHTVGPASNEVPESAIAAQPPAQNPDNHIGVNTHKIIQI